MQWRVLHLRANEICVQAKPFTSLSVIDKHAHTPPLPLALFCYTHVMTTHHHHTSIISIITIITIITITIAITIITVITIITITIILAPTNTLVTNHP